MKKSDFVYFKIFDYLDSELNNQIITEVPFFDDLTSTVITSDGLTINEVPETKGHIRNNQISESTLDNMLPNGIKTLKNKTKEFVRDKGLVLPVLRGINNYKNPDSIKWHKDFVNFDMLIDSKKRIVTFYVAALNPIDATFMVSPNESGPGIWDLGFKLNLMNNLFIGHNQNLGHEYQIITPNPINILSLLWYDLS